MPKSGAAYAAPDFGLPPMKNRLFSCLLRLKQQKNTAALDSVIVSVVASACKSGALISLQDKRLLLQAWHLALKNRIRLICYRLAGFPATVLHIG